ncbi:LytTR family DNA-binding domain-containing protein [Muricauda sp. MAR_2010_75]|uniref:LytR/AlgR family response regulator transcription factor n=1 Tax=Allomuricauda sp. MAR_2010_75 TaxID=1250232 RepID=UPI00056D1335|nr:response regulator [Muricauda sp. MAR_2010_75]
MAHRVIIVDDELLARKRIAELLRMRPEFRIEAECANGEEAVVQINRLAPDVLFLDVELKDLTGFDVLQQLTLQKIPLIVFITAYDNYAIQAFNNYALDFLLKPFKNQRFFETLDRIEERIKLNANGTDIRKFLMEVQGGAPSPLASRLPIRENNRTVFVNKDRIKYICASSYYSDIYSLEKKYTVRESLKNLMPQLNVHKFVRIHRSTIINIDYMQELVHSDYNEMDVRMQDQELFRISKSYKKEFLQKLGLG